MGGVLGTDGTRFKDLSRVHSPMGLDEKGKVGVRLDWEKEKGEKARGEGMTRRKGRMEGHSRVLIKGGPAERRQGTCTHP